METKYNLIAITKEEQELFQKEFQELLNKHSVYYEPVPTFVRDGLLDENGKPSPWKLVCQVLLQKKVEITKDGAIPSPFNEPIKEN